jgi:hypothetical protein
MISRKPPLWLYACILLTAGLSLFSIYFRYHAEQRNRAVGLCAEIDVIQALAASQGLTLQQGLRSLHLRGLNAVVIPEEYVAELFSKGDLQVVNGKYVTGTSDAMQRVLRGVRIRYPAFVNNESFVGATKSATAVQFPDVSMIRGVAVGLNPDQSAAAKAEGLLIIARCSNPPSASSDTVRETVKWARDLGGQVFLAQGEQVLGRRDALDVFIDTIKAMGMWYASPEFAKIGGDENVVEKEPGLVIRLHSAQGQELDKMTLPEGVDRYARAARERNQRLLLLRPVSNAAEKPLDDFGDFFQQVKEETERQGGVIGTPHPFEEPAIPAALFVAIAVSVIPVAIWTAAAFIPTRWWLLVLGLFLLALAAACFKPVGRPFMAFISAMVFPTAAFLILDGRNLRWWLWEYVVVSAISLTGGLSVAGLLNSLSYYIHAQQFLGVKVAHFAPILAIGAYFFYRFGLVKTSLRSPINWGKALLALVVLGALGFMIARTGNDNPAGVSGAELKLRALLDVILFVRPRTKEFLIGHPFLILGIGMLISLRRDEPKYQNVKGWITLFVMLGAIGQTSIVNTMCHIHTPLSLSLARIGVGMVAGGILGAVLWGVAKRLRPREGV